MSDEYRAALDRLSHVPGVQGALVVDGETGVPVVEELKDGVSGRAVAALVASLYGRAAQGTGAAEFGDLHTLQLQAGGGHVIASGSPDLLVVAVAEPSAQLGLVRLEARRAMEALT